MKFDGLIVTLFLVCILLTISVADNITGRTITSVSDNAGGCVCVNVPTAVCGIKDKVCLPVNVKIPLELEDTLSVPKDEVVAIPHVEKKGFEYVPYAQKEKDKIITEDASLSPKECSDKCGPLYGSTVKNQVIPYKMLKGVCVIDSNRRIEFCKKGEICTITNDGYGSCTAPPTVDKCNDKCSGSTAANVPNFYIVHYKEVGGKCVRDYSKPAENCKYYPYFEYGKFKECKIKNDGVGTCVETTRARNYALAAAIEEGYGEDEDAIRGSGGY